MQGSKVESAPQCPTCKEILDASFCPHAEEASPNPGDASLCSYCGEILKFTDDLQLVICTKADIKQLVDEGLGDRLLEISKIVREKIIPKYRHEKALEN